jgi:hippurate hydrolase
MGGEDFGRYARALGVPGLMYRVGAQPAERFAAFERGEGPPLPSLHSSEFAPDPEPTLATATRTLARLALALLAVEAGEEDPATE